MRKAITLVLILCSFSVWSMDLYNIDWETNTEVAYQTAAELDKNVFVLITAPSWCHWCQELEKNVLSRTDVTNYITANYVPLLLLDVVDGKRNPELSNFDFGGFPTVRVYDSNKQKVADVYTQDPQQFLTNLKANVDKQGAPKPVAANSYSGMDVTLQKSGSDSFILRQGQITRTFKIAAEDERYFYIYHEESGDYIAVPYAGGEAHMANNAGGTWSEWNVFGTLSKN